MVIEFLGLDKSLPLTGFMNPEMKLLVSDEQQQVGVWDNKDLFRRKKWRHVSH